VRRHGHEKTQARHGRATRCHRIDHTPNTRVQQQASSKPLPSIQKAINFKLITTSAIEQRERPLSALHQSRDERLRRYLRLMSCFYQLNNPSSPTTIKTTRPHFVLRHASTMLHSRQRNKHPGIVLWYERCIGGARMNTTTLRHSTVTQRPCRTIAPPYTLSDQIVTYSFAFQHASNHLTATRYLSINVCSPT
jgi:hypothetical protein